GDIRHTRCSYASEEEGTPFMSDAMATAMHSNGTGVRISGVGAEIPPDVVTSAEVEERAGLKRFGLEPGWLARVTGVRERRIAAPDVLPSQLAVAAATRALADAGIGPLDVDTLIFTGITRDCMKPATANVVADALGAREARVFDLDNACNGMIDGLDVADSLIRTGKARRVLITTGERASWSINWQPQSSEETLRSVAGLVVGDGGGLPRPRRRVLSSTEPPLHRYHGRVHRRRGEGVVEAVDQRRSARERQHVQPADRHDAGEGGRCARARRQGPAPRARLRRQCRRRHPGLVEDPP